MTGTATTRSMPAHACISLPTKINLLWDRSEGIAVTAACLLAIAGTVLVLVCMAMRVAALSVLAVATIMRVRMRVPAANVPNVTIARMPRPCLPSPTPQHTLTFPLVQRPRVRHLRHLRHLCLHVRRRSAQQRSRKNNACRLPRTGGQARDPREWPWPDS